MANYKEIKGLTVQSLSTDPSLGSGNEGQVWFNSTSGKLKSLVAFAAWSSTNSLVTPRQGYASSFGPQTAGIAAGGYTYPSPAPTNTAKCEEYNGTGWTNITDVNNPGYGSQGAGTIAAGICFGMASPGPLRPRTEEYDGTSWTAATAMNTGHGYFSGGGTLTAAIAAGGNVPAASLIAEEWNGTGWTTINSMVGTARTSYLGTGTTSAFWCAGGYTPPTTFQAETEQYDGTSWTAGGAPNTARSFGGASGPATAALQFGGTSANPSGDVTYNWAKTESYDGTTWTELGSEMSTARGQGFQLGTTNTAALVASGTNPHSNPAVEEYSVSINSVTAGAWATGGTLGTGRQNGSGMGISTAALVAGGEV
jgi:hypothetical protein